MGFGPLFSPCNIFGGDVRDCGAWVSLQTSSAELLPDGINMDFWIVFLLEVSCILCSAICKVAESRSYIAVAELPGVSWAVSHIVVVLLLCISCKNPVDCALADVMVASQSLLDLFIRGSSFLHGANSCPLGRSGMTWHGGRGKGWVLMWKI